MGSSDSFVHLHVHTEYSMLDGAARLTDLFRETSRMGMPALAMTDHGNVFGAYDFWKKATAAGVKPIIGCLVAGQEIVTSSGVRNVEDVQPGDRVLTHKGRFRRVVRTMSRPYEGRAYTVSLAGRYGRTLTLTEEHPILVRTRDGLLDWKKPGDIAAGRPGARGGTRNWNSYACLPRLQSSTHSVDVLAHMPDGFGADDEGVFRHYSSRFRADQHWDDVPLRLPLDYETGYLLGLFAAEGTCAKVDGRLTGTFAFHLHQEETHLAERLEACLARWGVSLSRHFRPENSSLHLYGCSIPLAHLFSELVKLGAANKRVPECVLSGPAAVRQGFLEGVLDGDGKNAKRESSTGGRRDLKTASRDLAWGVRTLLADNGHWSTVSAVRDWSCAPGSQEAKRTCAYMVSYCPKRSYSRSWEDAEYTYRPIKEVRPHYLKTEVYNFEVEDDNSYVSDFVLHNCEAYVTPRTHRSDRTRVKWGGGGGDDVSGGGAFTHMTLLAESTVGMHNLFRLSSRASLEGFFYKPRMDRELLATYASGLIATTGCPSGEVQTFLRLGKYDEARAAAAEFREIFGPENYYLELMDHGLEIQDRVRADLMRLAKDLSLPLVATNDLHYTNKEDAASHEVLLCVQSGSTIADPNRFKFDTDDFYLKSPEQMRRVWRELPEACDNTLLIAERCEVGFAEGANLMPRFAVPAGESEDSWLVKEVDLGLRHRFRGNPVPQGHRDRAAFELGVIAEMGFPGYFLVVADLCRYAREQGIRVGPGRGSATGAIIAWALGITELDPIEHKLLFERFLNPERVSMPDIDLDFDERRRGDMIRYATEKYGEDRVSQIITYGTIKAKQAVKDSSRVLGYPFAMGDRITKAMPPPVMGKDMPLAGIFDQKHGRYQEAGEFRTLYESDPDVHRVVDTAKGLEGLKRQWGVHAAGVILSSEPLLDVIPIMRREADGAIITQFDMGACESLGLLKMDFLGLRNLTVLDDCLANIMANRGESVVLETLGLDDKLTYELLARGDTLGVFQLDGGPMRSLLRSMRPDTFEDIAAVLALYRPGPMGANAHNDYADRKNGRKPVVPIHPELEEPLAEILGETHGLIVYQEQVMALAQRLAGYTLGQADLLRRAMGKKKKEILDKEYVPFSDGMRANGYSDASIKTLWDILVPFSDYAFNKSHTAGYGLVSYWTAYLKTNFPSEYMAALLTSIRDDKDKSALYLNECRRMGIKVLPPDVNESDTGYTPRGTDIRFGLSAIRNVGEAVVASIAATRSAKGRFADFYDFLRKVDPVACNKKTVESLIKAGAFDSLGHTRRGLLSVHAEAIDSFMDTKRNEAHGQFDLFSGAENWLSSGAENGLSSRAENGLGGGEGLVVTPEVPLGEWEKTALLAFEREMLGLYVSDHPLFGIEHLITAAADCSIATLTGSEDRQDGSMVTIGGLVTGLQRKVTKKGDVWAIASVEDLEGAIDVMFFPQTYQLYATSLAEDAVVVIRGRLDRREDAPKLVAMEMSLPDLSEGPRGPVVISLPVARCTPPVVERLKEVLATHPGATEVHLRLLSAARTTVLRLDDGLRVNASPALMGDLKVLLGPACLS